MAPAPASCLGTVAHCMQIEGGGLGLLGHGSPAGWQGVHTEDRQGVCWAQWQQDSSRSRLSWARCLCWGAQARHTTRASERGPSLLRMCVFILVTCCQPNRLLGCAVHRALVPEPSLLPIQCMCHLPCLQPPPAWPTLPGASHPTSALVQS